MARGTNDLKRHWAGVEQRSATNHGPQTPTYRPEDNPALSGVLSQSDTPEQILDRMGAHASTVARLLPPIATLCLEQIRLAFRDLTRRTPQNKANRELAREWIARPYDPQDECVDVANFEGCCLTLGIEPTRLRDFLLALPEATPRRRGPMMPRRSPAIQPVLLPRRKGRPPKILVARAA